jgi:hypothetical protein
VVGRNNQFEHDTCFANAGRAMFIGSLRADHCWSIKHHPINLIHLRGTSSNTTTLTRKGLSLLRTFDDLLVCAFIEVARRVSGFADIVTKLETFARKAAEGIMKSGFHTPNHRRVIVGALAQAQFLFPEIKADAIIESYLAQGIDIDVEGAYLENSIGVYDTVTNRYQPLWLP